MKYLIMCEGPNELEILRMLLEADRMIFTQDDVLNLTPYHARQIASSAAVKTALGLYPGPVEVLRIGDKLNEKLKIPTNYRDKIIEVKKYCTKPELEMLLILSEKLEKGFTKVKSSISPKTFAKEHIVYNRIRYNNSTAFYREYYGKRIDLLVDTIKRYKLFNGGHKRDEEYLADLLK